ncbi:MAG: ABC transporter transmembrane domain-containing protein [Nitrospira sp.]|nr:ATP-binding cassette domain-containing protein [Candidatus Manganitrophaceae bacterium]HIL35541.1 ATP-binding cassette domain-containing protein [Candidatus Manganitrophaceae bacterium]
MKLYLRLIVYLKPYRLQFFGAIFCALMVSIMTGTYAWIVRPVMDELFIKKDTDMLMVIPVAIFVVALLKGIFFYAQAYLMQYVGNHIVADIRKEFYQHIVLLPIGYHAKNSTGQLMSTVINDVGMIQMAVSTVVKNVVQQTLTLIALSFVVFYQNWRLACIAVLVMPVMAYPLIRLGKRLRKVARIGQEKIADLTNVLQETFSGIRVVKGFGREDFEADRFSKKNMDYVKALMRSTSVSELVSPVMETISSLGVAAIIWYGGSQVMRETMTPGTFFSFMTATMLMYGPIKGLSTANNMLQQAIAAAERIFEVWDLKNERTMDEGKRILPSVQGSVEFQDVSFSYDGVASPALSKINLKANPGDIIALVGSSGAGKSTLVNMIPRFYDVQQGAILIDGVSTQEVTRSSLRSQIGIVSQEIVLFDDTVRWNIAYGVGEVSEEKVIAAAKAAYADGFIRKMPLGYDTMIEKAGMNLSGGERQRLAIARALLKDPPILILDEATSALDSKSEFMVRKALTDLMKDRTTFVIAHRLSTIHKASCILVVDHGKIVEMGRHEELIRRDGPYKKVYQMQFWDGEEKVDETPVDVEHA